MRGGPPHRHFSFERELRHILQNLEANLCDGCHMCGSDQRSLRNDGRKPAVTTVFSCSIHHADRWLEGIVRGADGESCGGPRGRTNRVASSLRGEAPRLARNQEPDGCPSTCHIGRSATFPDKRANPRVLHQLTGDTDHGFSDSECQILLPRSALFRCRYLSMASPLR